MSKKKKLIDYFAILPEDQRTLAEKLAVQLEWMSGTLEKLKEKVDEDGPVITSTNGNGFTVVQEHPAQKSYNTMVKNYNSTIRQLRNMLPESTGEEDDEFEKFLNGDK